MTMNLHKIFSYNVQVHYKGYFLSKAMIFTLATTLLTIILPFVIAHRSRGFWLRSYSFYEQPKVRFAYEYLLVVETEDPSNPIICGEAPILEEDMVKGEENCAEIQVREYEKEGNCRTNYIDFKFQLVVPLDRTVIAIELFLGLDYRLKTICPLHMQALAIIKNDFVVPPSGYKYFGDIQLYQAAHLPCAWNVVDTKYNSSLFSSTEDHKTNIVESVLEKYIARDITTRTKTLYSRSRNGHTGTLDLEISLRVPEMNILYTPSVMQELKWAWPQYLSLVFIFYWIFHRLKTFVFSKRLLMSWEVVPWKKT